MYFSLCLHLKALMKTCILCIKLFVSKGDTVLYLILKFAQFHFPPVLMFLPRCFVISYEELECNFMIFYKRMPFKEKLRATLISLFENQLKAKEGMIKSNERIMKLMKEASFLKKKLRIKEKGRGKYFF